MYIWMFIINYKKLSSHCETWLATDLVFTLAAQQAFPPNRWINWHNYCSPPAGCSSIKHPPTLHSHQVVRLPLMFGSENQWPTIHTCQKDVSSSKLNKSPTKTSHHNYILGIMDPYFIQKALCFSIPLHTTPYQFTNHSLAKIRNKCFIIDDQYSYLIAIF